MRIYIIISALFFLCIPCAAQKQKKQKANAGMDYLSETFWTYDSIQKKIHRYAELGYLEQKSSRQHINHLKSHGFSIEEGIAGIPTAFVATYGEGYPVIGLLAEYDALPGMSQDTVPYQKPMEGQENGHACGHNLLGTATVAAAVAISKYLASGHKGTIKLYGCPAEEGGGGKAYLTREGCFNGVDAVLDWHPSTSNGVAVKTGLANVLVDFRFKGKASHASGAPEKGRSALDAVEAFNYMMNMMREHIPMTTKVHYIITNGGKAANVVPDFAEVEYFIRSPKRDIVQDVFQRAIKAAEGAAMGTGTTMTYEIMSGNYERLYNPTLGALIQKNMEKVGGVKLDEREKKFYLEVMKNSGMKPGDNPYSLAEDIEPLEIETETMTGASTDVGNISWVVPLASFSTATFAPGGGGHCWQQTASGGTTIGTKGMMNTAKIMCLTAQDLYEDTKLIDQAKAEFESRRGKDFVFKALIGDRKPPLDYRLKNK